MSGGATPGAEGTSLRATYYFFASATAGPRRRRIGDLGALLVSLGLLAIGMADHDTTGDVGDHLTQTLTSIPSIAADAGRAIVIVSSAYALAILVTSGVRRRFALTRDMLVAAVGAFTLAVVLGRLVAGEWPQVGTVTDVAGARDYPVVRIAVLSAALLVGSPDLSRPFRRLSHAAVVLSGIAAVVMAAGAAPTSSARSQSAGPSPRASTWSSDRLRGHRRPNGSARHCSSSVCRSRSTRPAKWCALAKKSRPSIR